MTPPVPLFPLNPDKAEWSVWDFPDVVDHWNFPGYEGKKMTVSVYSNCEQIELFLNGESLGKQENTVDKKKYACLGSTLCSWNIESREL